MGERWNLLELHSHKVLRVLLLICLLTDECLSINLEGSALLEFRSRVESDPYGALNNWDPSDSNPCNWNGVGCVDGKVVMLNLKELSLHGTLASDIAKLSHLQALVLSRNYFYGVIPKEIGRLTMLELLDLRKNMLNGTIPKEIGEILSLKHLLLCHNKFKDHTLSIENSNLHFDMMHNPSPSCDVVNDPGYINRKVKLCFWEIGWQKFKNFNSFLILLKERIIHNFDIIAVVKASHPDEETERNGDLVEITRRRLAADTKNLIAAPGSSGPVPQEVGVPPVASGSFSALRDKARDKPSPSLVPPPSPPTTSPPLFPSHSSGNDHPLNKRTATWTYILVLPIAALLLTLATCMFLVLRKKGAVIGPWRTGLSGQLQRAFVTGVPKLKRAELVAACEEFSNVVVNFPDFTIYKGTLSSGVEIAVVSTAITSASDWSRHAESLFKKKIETLSRINHKNFINLLGYCVEDEPFMRMMVLEYASNGTLYEHLHGEEYEHLDWNARMRIIMGTAYCLQHMHELDPSISHPNLQSNTILVSEDFAAKILDVDVWKEIFVKLKNRNNDNLDESETLAADPATNVYSFGMLLLEVVSGKVPCSDEHSSIQTVVSEYLNGNGGAGSLVDPTLKSHKDEELNVICQVILDCVNPDPKNRPTMKEVTSKLRVMMPISPETATPKPSPLWWAELEILPAEAS